MPFFSQVHTRLYTTGAVLRWGRGGGGTCPAIPKRLAHFRGPSGRRKGKEGKEGGGNGEKGDWGRERGREGREDGSEGKGKE